MGLYDLQSRCCQLPTMTINMSQQSFLVTKWTDLFPGVIKLNQLHLKDICQKIMISSFEWLIIMLFFPVIESRTNSLLRPLQVLSLWICFGLLLSMGACNICPSLYMAYSIWCNGFEILERCSICIGASSLFYGWILFCGMNILHFVCPFIKLLAFRFFPRVFLFPLAGYFE